MLALKKCSLYLVSLGLTLFAQPDISVLACFLSSIFGYGLLWLALNDISRKKQFFLALIWFALTQAYQLNWFTADKYVGSYIFIFYFFWVLCMGFFFALLCLLILQKEKGDLTNTFFLAGLWTIFEWSRLLISSGFSWNPIGLSMTANIYSMQLVSILGLFGLTFWVLATNILFYKTILTPFKRTTLAFGTFALFPYLFGATHILYHKNLLEKSPKLSTVLVQTALYPEEKYPLSSSQLSLHPLDQWKRIFHLLKEYEGKKIDLIVLSEACVPYGTHHPLFSFEEAEAYFKGSFNSVPQRTADKVGNAFFAQSLANHFDADVVIGLEDAEIKEGRAHVYNAGFLFHPYVDKKERYEKRVLVPLGEFIPFSFFKSFLKKHYGIEDSFTKGVEAKVFQSKIGLIGMSICYEETYGHLMRENRKKGATLLVNLTNDAWYPRSRLPVVHYHHGKVRSVEGGVPLLRACNTGVTCGVDSLGRSLGHLVYENKHHLSEAKALYLEMPTYTYKTLYTYFGDFTIILLSAFFLLKKILRVRFARLFIQLFM